MEELIRLIPNILRAANNAEEVLEAATLAAWRRVAGEGLREHAVPFRLYEKTLIVAVADANWRNQMEGMSRKLLFRLNSMLGQAAVTYIEFRVDPQTVDKMREESSHRESEREEFEARALESAAGLLSAAENIKDEKLRRKFLLAAGSCLERRHRESGI
jgi:hypothetical protein